MKKDKKEKRKINARDVIMMIILIVIVVTMIIFTTTRETGNQEIILMEIYKSAGPETSTSSPNHYYIYENTNVVGIRSSNFDDAAGQSSNNVAKTEITQDLINDFKIALEEYISKNVTINTGFYINERYTIEYNGKTVIVPNPSVATALGYDSSEYTFYNTVDNFINNINN